MIWLLLRPATLVPGSIEVQESSETSQVSKAEVRSNLFE